MADNDYGLTQEALADCDAMERDRLRRATANAFADATAAKDEAEQDCNDERLCSEERGQ